MEKSNVTPLVPKDKKNDENETLVSYTLSTLYRY